MCVRWDLPLIKAAWTVSNRFCRCKASHVTRAKPIIKTTNKIERKYSHPSAFK